MSLTTDLLAGLAVDMDAEGLADYTPGVVGGNVFLKRLPTTPNRAVALAAYQPQDDPTQNLTIYRVQFRFRGNPNDSTDVDDFADDVFLWLQGLQNRSYGSVQMRHARRVSSIDLGTDASKRAERSDNYALTCNLPQTSGRPE